MKRRKKSKYKHALIGNKKYYFYKIVWQDPTGDSGHAEANEMKSLTPATMITQDSKSEVALGAIKSSNN